LEVEMKGNEATCHVKPTLTLARGSEAKQEFRRKIILKAPRCPQLGIDEA